MIVCHEEYYSSARKNDWVQYASTVENDYMNY